MKAGWNRLATVSCVAGGLVCAATWTEPLFGQEPTVILNATPATGVVVEGTVIQVDAAEAATAQAAGQKNGPEAKAGGPNGNGKKKGGPNAEAKSADTAEKKPTVRPDAPATPPDPAELEVQPDADNRLSFSFKGQSWPDVLQWLADISDMSLEWQEAPAGYLDLTTRGRYTVEEIRDLINSVLLSRGYTLLRNGEILLVTKAKDIDVSLVPRITADELDARGKYELVRVFFDLQRLRAETVAEEIKPLLSPYGKITPLKTTNRIDVLDTAGNLRRLREMIDDEQSASGQEFDIRQFPLKHIRAADAQATLETLLGLDKKKPAVAMSPEQQMQAQQQAMMMAQRNGGKPQAQPDKSEPEVFLAVNSRENSVLAVAAPDKLAVIEQIIQYLDVPSEGQSSLLSHLSGFRVYRLVGVEPEPLVKVLQEIGGLDPMTKLEVDSKNKAIFVSGPLVDHVTVQALIDKVDGSARKFDVIPLRKLDAEYVAGSIEFLMGGAKQEEKKSRNSYSYYDFYSRGSNTEETKTDKFQVEADVEHNRLLLWANDIELQEINRLLVKLGEVGADGSRLDTTRVIPLPPGEEQQQLIERIERLWPTVRPNPLIVDPGSEVDTKAAPAQKIPSTPTEPTTDEVRSNGGSVPSRLLSNAVLTESTEVEDPDATAQSREEPRSTDRGSFPNRPLSRTASNEPPISLAPTEEGIVVSSQDPVALDRLMELVDRLQPANRRYRVFTLKNTYADDVVLLLEDIFTDEEPAPDRSSMFRSYYYGYDDSSSKNTTERGRLSNRRPLQFVADGVTNTILVQGASEDQLREIESLIELYDRVESPDSQSVRRTEIIPVKYGKASEIAAVIKSVYRDLLSPNDESLQRAQPQQEKQERSYYSYLFGEDDTSASSNAPRFKGLLSVGVESRTENLVISAPQYLLDEVMHMVQTLDQAAQSQAPVSRIIHAGGVANNSGLKSALNAFASGAASTTRQSDRSAKSNGDAGDGQSDRRRGQQQAEQKSESAAE